MRTGQGFGPYAGLPWPVQVLFWVVLAVSVSSLVSLVVLQGNVIRQRRRPVAGGEESQFLWVFVVPALNEEVTIADSVSRLRAVDATHRLILVVDDGSDDGTGSILAGLTGPDLVVLRRDPPQARIGKAAALNAAWRHVHAAVLPSGRGAGFDPPHTLVVVVDADGRLHPAAPTTMAAHFADPRTAGVQSLVRIYNRGSWLTWAQDVEFGVFGRVFQAGRGWWGTANMGGNGQANRLSALDEVAVADGPWRDRLTEDQDIGVRLLQAGWHGAQDLAGTVDQQGLPSLRRLYRQRTRWAQGAWQALTLLRGVRRAPQTRMARLDMAYYLLTPVLQVVTGVGLVAAIVLAAVADLSFWSETWPMAVFFATLSFGPALVALAGRGRGVRSALSALVLVLPYTIYSWLIFPVLLRSLARMAFGRSSWAKTPREPVTAVAGDAEAG